MSANIVDRRMRSWRQSMPRARSLSKWRVDRFGVLWRKLAGVTGVTVSGREARTALSANVMDVFDGVFPQASPTRVFLDIKYSLSLTNVSPSMGDNAPVVTHTNQAPERQSHRSPSLNLIISTPHNAPAAAAGPHTLVPDTAVAASPNTSDDTPAAVPSSPAVAAAATAIPDICFAHNPAYSPVAAAAAAAVDIGPHLAVHTDPDTASATAAHAVLPVPAPTPAPTQPSTDLLSNSHR